MILWSFKGKIAKLGKTKPKVQPVPNKLLNPGMPPRNESSSPWPFLVYLWTHILMKKRSHNRWASLRKLHRHLCEEIQAETKWLPGSEFRPQLHMQTFWVKNPTYNESAFSNLIAAGRQAGRKDYFFHNHSFHPGISTYFKKQEYEAYLLVASSIDFYNRAL